MIGYPGEEDNDVWLEIGSLLKDVAKAVAWFLLVAVISGTTVSLVALRYMAA